jgi:hypothetical protein
MKAHAPVPLRWIESKIIQISSNSTEFHPLPGGEGERKTPSVPWQVVLRVHREQFFGFIPLPNIPLTVPVMSPATVKIKSRKKFNFFAI